MLAFVAQGYCIWILGSSRYQKRACDNESYSDSIHIVVNWGMDLANSQRWSLPLSADQLSLMCIIDCYKNIKLQKATALAFPLRLHLCTTTSLDRRQHLEVLSRREVYEKLYLCRVFQLLRDCNEVLHGNWEKHSWSSCDYHLLVKSNYLARHRGPLKLSV